MFDRHASSQQPLSSKPRRVRGGVRLVAREWPLAALSWPGREWLDVVRSLASEETLLEAFQYARGGQTRTLDIDAGRIQASVQGRALRAYRVTIEVPTFTDEQWESVIAAMADQAIYGARMLAGEMPEAVGELFDSLGLRLVPSPQEFRSACSAPDEAPWCKHVCCAAILVAEALEKRPFEIFTLRGLSPGVLIERLRDRRAATGAASPGGAPGAVGVPLSAGPDTPPSPPLEASIEDFWEAGPALESFETPLRKPEVSYALLRRLGPSPFTEGRFPLVGLLATCYNSVSRSALQEPADTAPANSTEPSPPSSESRPAAATAQPKPVDATGAWPLGSARRKKS